MEEFFPYIFSTYTGIPSQLETPNVYFHNHFPTLGEKISKILNDFVYDGYSEKLLTAFISSIYDTGYEIDYGGAMYQGRDLDIIWKAYKNEISRVKYLIETK